MSCYLNAFWFLRQLCLHSRSSIWITTTLNTAEPRKICGEFCGWSNISGYKWGWWCWCTSICTSLLVGPRSGHSELLKFKSCTEWLIKLVKLLTWYVRWWVFICCLVIPIVWELTPWPRLRWRINSCTLHNGWGRWTHWFSLVF